MILNRFDTHYAALTYLLHTFLNMSRYLGGLGQFEILLEPK